MLIMSKFRKTLVSPISWAEEQYGTLNHTDAETRRPNKV